MKSMREMISLMEGVMAVPGLNEKSTSEKQARFMAAAAHDPKFAKKAGIEQDVAKEFNQADKGTEQLSKAMSESVPAIDSCQQDNPATADIACAMESMGERSEVVAQALADFQNMVTNHFMDPDAAYDRIIINLDDESLAEFDQALEQEGLMSYGDDDGDTEPSGSFDGSDDAEALASAGHGSDEDYGYYGDDDSMEEGWLSGFSPKADPKQLEYAIRNLIQAMQEPGADVQQELKTMAKKYDIPPKLLAKEWQKQGAVAEDIQNGYNDIHNTNGNDYFPNGADGPVVNATGPSGARQGDNPEQKKMQIAEVHKELVYSYRSFLGESAIKKKN